MRRILHNFLNTEQYKSREKKYIIVCTEIRQSSEKGTQNISEFQRLCLREREIDIEMETWFDETRTSCHLTKSLWEERQEEVLTQKA